MEKEAVTAQYDFLTNVKDRTFPKGMSIEFIRTAFYKEKILWIESKEAYKEHVTFAFYDNPPAEMKVKFFYNEKFPKLSGSDLALDSPEDFKFIERMIEELGTKMKNYTLKEIEDAYVKLER
jgi:spore coat polysaccharide biosynthesis protein SpsF